MRALPLGERPSLIIAHVGVHGGDRQLTRYYQETGLWSLHLYLYSAELRIGDERHVIRPGSLAVAPPECTLEYHLTGRSEHLYALFNVASDTQPSPVPAIQPLGDSFDRVRADFQEMIVLGATNPLRAEVKLWDLLLRAAETARPGMQNTGLHPAVSHAMRLIEQRIGGTIALEDLASDCGLSHSHLARLFRAEMGLPPIRYINRRRLEIALNLLRHTNIPIHAIAEQVGIADLQLFNKMIRRVAGISPRAIRAGGDFAPGTAPIRQ
ncbi:MAG: helix-turn-helix transcriptional regulator [Capsulimonadaceae bacterium]|nr:helix-turn-helix transcriptional regulator [Capsulimonadaceae bacterium]